MGEFFSDADMAELQTVAESAMSGTLVIKRPVRTSDGMGGYTEVYTPVGTVPCHIWRTREANEIVSGAMVQSKADWYVAVPVGTDIREIDYGEYNGITTYQIIHVPLDVTWNPHIRCEAITLNRELRD